MADAGHLLARQGVLADFGDFVLDHDDLDEVLNEACRLIARALQTDLAKVIEVEHAAGTGLVRAGFGWDEGIVGRQRVSLSERSSEAFAIAGAEPVITNDIAAETRFHFPGFLVDHGVKALVNVPIFLPGRRPWGVLQVDARRPRDFDSDDVNLLKTYAMVLGPVIDRFTAVAERELARRGLAEREVRLHQILDTMGEGFGVLDPDFIIIEHNREATRIDGRAHEEIIGRSHWEVYPGSEHSELGKALKKAMTERVPTTLEHEMKFPDGRTHWFEMRAYPVVDGTLAVLWQDISERKRSLDQIQRSEEWLRSAIEVGRIGLWDWEVPSGAVSWSDEHFRMLGHEVGAIVPSYAAWLESVHPQDRPREESRIRDCMASGDDYAAEFRVLHADGVVHWLRARGRFFYGRGGEPLRMVGAALDVTEQRAMQERQDVLVAELQHRTRNLIGLVRALSDKTAANSDDFAEFRSKFRERLDALARVQGLLSRLSSQHRLSFDALLEAELDALQPDRARDLVHLSGPKGVLLRSSMVQSLAMALHELATNAVKYGALGQEGARLTVEWCVKVPEDDEQGRRWLHIDWRESGVTMPAATTRGERSGQGRELIEHALPYQLGARTRFTLGPDGVHCTIMIPVSRPGK